jgi:hypothetical protein
MDKRGLAIVLVVILLALWIRRGKPSLLGFAELPPEPKKIRPELDILKEHQTGQSGSEQLSADCLEVRSGVLPEQHYAKSLLVMDGVQMEGMSAPTDEFERQALLLQDAKKSFIYGTADGISTANI